MIWRELGGKGSPGQVTGIGRALWSAFFLFSEQRAIPPPSFAKISLGRSSLKLEIRNCSRWNYKKECRVWTGALWSLLGRVL